MISLVCNFYEKKNCVKNSVTSFLFFAFFVILLFSRLNHVHLCNINNSSVCDLGRVRFNSNRSMWRKPRRFHSVMHWQCVIQLHVSLVWLAIRWSKSSNNRYPLLLCVIFSIVAVFLWEKHKQFYYACSQSVTQV